jgi:Helix-turn-helix domain
MRRMSPDDFLEKNPKQVWKRDPAERRFRLLELKGASLAVWDFYLLSSDEFGIAFPSRETIAKFTGYSTKVVGQARAELVAKGWLVPIKQQNVNGRWREKNFLVCYPPSRTEPENYVGKKLPVRNRLDENKVPE